MWTSWDTRCGIASYAAALVGELRRLDVEVDIVPVPYTERAPERQAEILGRLNAADVVHIQHEYTFFGGIAPRASTLAAYYRGLRKPRVVTAHTVFTAAELLRLAHEKRPRQKLAKTILAALPSYRAHLEREPFAGAAAVIVHTEAARHQLMKQGISSESIHVLPAGIPSAASVSEANVEQLRSEWGMEGGRMLTIFGYVTPDKGYELALDALKGLPPTVKLLIAGGTRVEHERGYLDQLREQIKARGLEGRVTITGYLEEEQIAAAMAMSDLVLVPHLAANGSYSVLIALSYGKPVLASDLACFSEIAEAGGGVELFPAGNAQALSERIGFLLASAAARNRLAEGARTYAAGRSWATVAARTRAIYEDALRIGK